MISRSNNSVYYQAAASYPAGQEADKAVSVSDLTKSTDTLLRSHKADTVIWEEASVTPNTVTSAPGPGNTQSEHRETKSSPTKTPAISSRSQSLNNIGKSKMDIGSHGRSRSSNTIGSTSSTSSASSRKSSTANMLEQRRRSTMTKLKGLVIPEMVSETGSGVSQTSGKERAVSDKTVSSSYSKQLSNPPWKDKGLADDFPKYSPAFKRKPFTVYGTLDNKKTSEESSPSTESSRSQQKQPVYKPPIGKRNSDEGSVSVLKTEDSDNDSAVSSGRSSLSCRSCTPPSSPKSGSRSSQNNKNSTDSNPRVLKKNSVEAINRQNVLNACKKSSATEPPLETSSPRAAQRTVGRPASRSSSFTINERKKSFESQHSDSSRRGSNSSHDSVSRKSSRDSDHMSSARTALEEAVNSRRSSRVTTPTSSCNYPDSIMDIEEKVAFMSEVVDRASSVTPTERRSLSRTPSIASERSSYSSRSSRNSSIVSEKAPFARNNSIMSKDSAISEDISKEIEEKSPKSGKKWSDLEKKYSRGLSSGSIGETISKLSKSSEDGKNERPKDLMIAQKKITNGINSPGSKNFKELAEKWQTMSVPDTPVTPTNPTSMTLPRKSSKEKLAKEETTRDTSSIATLPRRASRDKSPVRASPEEKCVTPGPVDTGITPTEQKWSPPAAVKGDNIVNFIQQQCLFDCYRQVRITKSTGAMPTGAGLRCRVSASSRTENTQFRLLTRPRSSCVTEKIMFHRGHQV